MRILVGISGGVDSALTALTLKEQGHEVVCAMMKIYDGEQLSDFANSCYGIDKAKEIEDAKAICEKIGTEFHLIDCSKQFDTLVFKEFQNEYSKGRTPNPCVICNPKIKFGEFLDMAIKSGIEFDKFATGHYARVEFDENSQRYLLKTGKNLNGCALRAPHTAHASKKDQSYFLYNLSQEQLSKIIFPLGANTKEQTRKLAEEKELIVAKKPDSQDFFKGDYSCLLNLEPKTGNIVGTDGKIYGQHNGIWNFTIGQRKGLKIAHSEPLYVLKLNADTNEVVVGVKSETFCDGLIAENPNWIAFDTLQKELNCTCKIRSAQTPVPCKISQKDDKITVKFVYEEAPAQAQPQASIAPGQAVVFYQDDIVLGGATITEGI